MAAKIILVSFASNHSFEIRQKILNITALKYGGFTETKSWTIEKIKQTEFYSKHKNILDQKRGAGYWLWKPYIIFHELNMVNDGDFIVYYDCGRWELKVFRRNIKALLEWCKNNKGILPGIYIPQYGPNSKWIKRDCFILMNCDEEQYWNHCMLQTSFSIWQKNSIALTFLKKQLYYSTDERILTDIQNVCGYPNLNGFVEHRDDQSVLTLCALKYGLNGFGNANTKEPFCENDKNIDLILGKMGVDEVRSINKTLYLGAIYGFWYFDRLIQKFLKMVSQRIKI